MRYVMDEKSSSNIYLETNSLNAHIEKIQDFNQSYFKSVYKYAFLQLDDIISCSLSSDGYFGSTANSNKEISNILTFIGKRGSGKTSLMLSFMEALKDYYRYNKENSASFYRFRGEGDVLFTCLDCIDSSLLEHGEDIFKIVLAMMYQKFIDLDNRDEISKDKDFGYSKRELLKKLEDVYRTVCDIEDMDKRTVSYGESYMSNIQSLSSSQKLKKDFGQLIKQFTALMKYKQSGWEECSKRHYLVITIDDIDLNINNGFSMLEKIHRYCMVPNVIVLISIDVQQMLSIVSKNFYEVVPRVDTILKREEKRIHRLSIDYLNKVMPLNYRIYLPDISEFQASHFVTLKKEQVAIKQAIFGKLYRRMGICFDSKGLKRHFYEPESMRQLTCFYLLLESMDSIKTKFIYYKSDIIDVERQEIISKWEENERVLLADLSNRLVIEKIYDDKKAAELWNLIKIADIRRAQARVIEFYYNNCELTENKKELLTEDYSYGELVEAIYYLGRIKNAKYKPLVHCLLAYFSYEFTREYILEKLNNKNTEKESRFKSLIGKNILNEWANKLLPGIVEKDDFTTGIDEKSTLSSSTEEKVKGYFGSFNSIVLSEVFGEDLESIDNLSDINERYEYVAQLIQNIELLSMFFYNIREQWARADSEGFSWEFDVEKGKTGNYRLIIKGKKKQQISFVGDFNILNFVANSMYAVQHLEKVETDLYNNLTKHYEFDKNMQVKTNFKKVLNKYSLLKQYRDWENIFGEKSIPIPLYWFDFSYNILKRTRREVWKNSLMIEKIEDMFDYIGELYQTIGEQLREQEEFYAYGINQEEQINRSPYKIEKRFTDCPVVKYFEKNKSKKGDNSKGNNNEKKENVKRQFIDKVIDTMRLYSEKL